MQIKNTHRSRQQEPVTTPYKTCEQPLPPCIHSFISLITFSCRILDPLQTPQIFPQFFILSSTGWTMSLSTTTATNSVDPGQVSSAPNAPAASPSLTNKAISQTLTSTANLANLLPTGTLLAFQLLMPIFSNNGNCDSMTRFLTQLFLLALAASGFLASFTDSFTLSDGVVYYGFATFKGMWLFAYPAGKALPDLSKYKIRPIDWIHAVLSVLVFAAVAFRDKTMLSCFYPTPEKETQEALNIVPVAIGLVSSMLFVIFPTQRHGIGYPVKNTN